MSGIDDTWKDIADSFRAKWRDQTAEAYDMLARKTAFDRGELTATQSEEFVGAYKEYVKECAKEREVATFDGSLVGSVFTTTDLSADAGREPMTYEQFCSIKREPGSRAQRVTAERKIKEVIHCYQTFNDDGSVVLRRSDNNEIVLTISPPPAPEIPENAKDNPALFDAINNIESNPEHGMRSNLSKWS